jgi:C4-dicarboxylate-specific signal transduction histidine kinase
MKIKTRIISTFLTIFVVVSLILIAITGILSSSSLINQVQKLLDVTSITKANHLRTYFTDQKEMISVMAASSVFRDFLKESSQSVNYPLAKQKAEQRLTRTIKVDKNIDELFLIDNNGKVAASSDSTQEGTDKTNNSFFV